MPDYKKGSKNLFTNLIGNLYDDDWKRVRNQVTPVFTTGKLKKLIPILCKSSDRLCNCIELDFVPENKELPLRDLYRRLVLDIIGHAGFSLNFNIFEEEHNEFVEQTKAVLCLTHFNPLKVAFRVFCPFICNCYEHFTGIDSFCSPATEYFENLMNHLYDQRRADPEAKEKYVDIFQLLMNTVEDKDGGGGNAIFEDMELVSGQYGKYMTRNELFAQSFVMVVAGFDTTAATLNFATYSLAMHQEIQEKLRDEIANVLDEEENTITYEHLKQMHYLQAVVQETSRMYPVAPKMNRECNADCVINGIPFHRGDLVALPIYTIQHDEEYYPEPEKFDPERFMPENKATLDPITFLAFGLGPRNCFGMRFAEFQMHIALAFIVRRFRLVPGPNTPKLPLELTSSHFLLPVKPLVVLAEKL